MDTEIKKMDGASLDISKQNKERLKQLFPSVFIETADDKGKVIDSIDFEKLKAELGNFSDVFESRKERYGMDWPGKKEALRLIQTPSYATLKPVREESVDFDTTENLFIEGDNLEVLKLLQKSYYNKVKMIYIDPPYNTGKEFIYPDNYSESLETYLEYAGLVDGDGKKFSTNTASEGRFHTKWMNMMYPRLYLARNLLKEDGVIFISIDDNEVTNLRKIGDDIFGEENFIETLVWKRRATPPNDRIIGKNHEYIIVYSKNLEQLSLFLQPRDEQSKNRYSNPDSDPLGAWASSDLSANGKGGRLVDSCVFPIKNPFNNKDYWPPKNKCWLYNSDKINDMLKQGKIGFRSNTGAPFLKRYLSEVRDGVTLPTIIDNGGYSQDSAKEIKDLFGSDVFEFPKPSLLLKKIIYCGLGMDGLTLDFFAGASTTAHSVLDLNKQDGGSRKFIMVQLPEPCKEDSEAFKAGYKTIADIGKERIRRVIKQIKSASESNLDLENKDQDLGFKVLKLDKSNFKQWQMLEPDASAEKIEEQLHLHIDHVSHESTQEDLLYEIMVKAGIKPTEKIETKKIDGIPIFSIADGGLIICLADKVTKELINAVAELEPLQFMCLDSAFGGNDQLKANAVQTFKARNQGRSKETQIIFRTI